MKFVSLFMVSAMLVGCVPTVAPATAHTLPEPLVAAELPPEPEQVPLAERWTTPVDDVEVEPGDVRSGILFSDAMAMRAAQLSVEYGRIRGMYLVDIRTWERERQVYDRHLTIADETTAALRVQAQRSWWEINGDEVGLVLGLVLGVGVSIGIGAIMAELGN